MAETREELEALKIYGKYIDMPHHTSSKHPPMSLQMRAAQFAPFAALTGYEDKVRERARIVDSRIELTDDKLALIDLNLKKVLSSRDRRVEICYFVEDALKEGGAYITVEGAIRRVDQIKREILLEDRSLIHMDDILKLESKSED